MGVIQCGKCNLKSKLTNFMLKFLQIFKFHKMHAKCVKICYLYVKFDTQVEKRGSLGVD